MDDTRDQPVVKPREPLRKRLLGLLRRGAVALVVLGIAGVILAYLVPLPQRLSAPDCQVVEYRDGSLAHVFLSPDEKWRIAVDPGAVDPAYLQALLRLEDKRFYRHPGVDPVAVGRALAKNIFRGRVVSGASTLSMQLARVLEPRPRSLSAKLLQTLRALQLEVRLSKREILAAYLRYLPFGHNLEGVEAAAWGYFGHSSRALTAAEIATLLAVPQDPVHRVPAPGHEARLRRARDAIAARLYEARALPLGEGTARLSNEAALQQVRESEVPTAIRPLPREAPHAAIWFREQEPKALRYRTTLDRGLTRLAERTLRSAQAEAARRGIYNATVVLVDKERAEVRALIGNFDFWDKQHGGQIVGFDVPRSPGSALKPLIYALSIDRGVALPDFLVPDAPLSFPGYTPHNFERRYAGLVTLSEALARSLNLPFVHLLNNYGVERFIGDLRSLGITRLDNKPGRYGLSAAVGGIELSPLELADLFTTIAAGGVHRTLRTLRDEPNASARGDAKTSTATGVRALSPGAAYLVQRALTVRDRPDFPRRRQLGGEAPVLAWKTGTSFGHRDAWTAGYGRSLAAVVWLGNFDHRGTDGLIGAEVAAPIFFDLLEAAQDGLLPVGDPPPDLVQIEVCAYSGHPPSPACPNRRTTLAPVRSVPTLRCPYHQSVEVDVQSGLAVTPLCRDRYKTERRTFLWWPPSLRRFLYEQRQELPAVPRYAPGCAPPETATPPVLLSPRVGQVVLLIPGLPRDRQAVPLQAESQRAATLSWFVDGEFLGTHPPEERIWWTPQPGDHEVVVTDDAGRSARRALKVRQPD